jgi:kynureninase
VTIGLKDVHRLDQADLLGSFRDEFLIPRHPDGSEQLYFCGNSLGLQPKSAAAAVGDELEAWRTRAVEGHFSGDHPWTAYHTLLQRPLAKLAGARPAEVIAMNSLTVNLHLLMVSFFRPAGRRNRILIERQPFPSDRYAVESQLRLHGLDPAECLVEFGAGAPERIIDEARVEAYLDEEGDRVALVLWPGLHYASGQWFDLRRITAAAHAAGARVGFDLAHTIGNVPLQLHDDGPDFAAWCTYKYLNAGPGAIAGAFIHERHHGRADVPRLNGWWGADPASRFLMGPEFQPAPGADAWQLSNPPILAMAPLRASLELFEAAGMDRLRRKSLALTGLLERLIAQDARHVFEILTPSEPERRGCQLSLRVRAGPKAGRQLYQRLLEAGVVTDWREPDVIRVAPVPLYNRFEDCWGFVQRALDCAG